MKISELKQALKPLIKECIKEIIFEKGLLSGIVSEVVQGLNGSNQLVETRAPVVETKPTGMPETRKKLNEQKKQLLDAIGKEAYGGVNLFEGTTPMGTTGTPGDSPQASPMMGIDSDDPGIDISKIPGSSNWSRMI